MKKKLFAAIIIGTLLTTGPSLFGASGKTGGKPPPDPDPVPATPIDGYYFWRLGHMDGPHDLSMALGISRDGKVAVGSTKVVDFWKAFRIDIDWAISTGDGIAPLYNELQVQENIGNGAAYAASDKDVTADCAYSKLDPEDPSSTENLDWCGSLPVGTLTVGTVSYAAEWLWCLDLVTVDPPPNYVAIPDFGGGLSEMVAKDVSADGVIIVGTGNVQTGPVAFLAATNVVDLESGVPIAFQLTISNNVTDGQTLQTSSAEAVSPDGTIIVGFGGTKTGNKAFITTVVGIDVTTGLATLESYLLPALAGGKWCEALAMTITPEGVVYIAGRSDSPKGPQACIWFMGDDPTTTDVVEIWSVKGLGGLSKQKYNSVATGIVYRPGSTAGDLMVVGTSATILYPAEAFVWTGNPVLVPDGPYTLPDGTVSDYIGYMYDLEKILIKTGAAEASGMGSAWILNAGNGVALSSVVNAGETGPSARIVGWGTNPEGGGEAWLVTNFPYDDLVFVKE